ncbi:hypothetical protein CARUB_v10018267mg [Capsella rubella]|uniref:Uncharacterized protein n=1 Tax=Capsella rubella TaxID=81985 RepID=R0HIE5_9BRAS|nr:hypothetical protein CARUB_v10018267mg [Capsella rubella]
MEACVGAEQDQRRRSRRRRRLTNTSTVFFWGILIFARFGLSSSSAALSPDQHHHHHHQSYPSAPRKAGPFHETSSFRGPKASVSFTGPRREEENRDDVYKDDKRLVHTGPNPLHN